jgi:hypothetical protein
MEAKVSELQAARERLWDSIKGVDDSGFATNASVGDIHLILTHLVNAERTTARRCAEIATRYQHMTGVEVSRAISRDFGLEVLTRHVSSCEKAPMAYRRDPRVRCTCGFER